MTSGDFLYEQIRSLVSSWHQETRAYLKTIPAALEFDIRLESGSPLLIPTYGVGGYAAASGRIVLAVNPVFPGDRDTQLSRLREAVFHECYHVAHGFVADRIKPGALSALASAAFEGAATVFERERAGSDPPWGRYLDEETMLAWRDELAALPLGYDYRRWKFWDACTGRRWIIYRTGTFLVDRALSRHCQLEIEDLAELEPERILALAEDAK